jgi:putative two-component system response regulator
MSDADEERGLALGAVDDLTKPIRPTVLQARVATPVELQQARLHLARRNRELGAEVGRHMRENQRISQVTLHALRRLAETRDNETGNHLRRTSAYVRLLATRLAGHPRHAVALDAHSIDLMARSASLHDIGKVGIPDRVLHKHGPLDADERAMMQSHAALGAAVIERAERDVGGGEGLGFLRCAKQIARHHHEHWDGTGYPDGLAGEAIPLPARLMAVADVFDALTSPRRTR